MPLMLVLVLVLMHPWQLLVLLVLLMVPDAAAAAAAAAAAGTAAATVAFSPHRLPVFWVILFCHVLLLVARQCHHAAWKKGGLAAGCPR